MENEHQPWETVLKPQPLSGAEPLPRTSFAVQDYWRWAHSDLMSNVERGVFAEYLVARAVGDETQVRDAWAVHDVTMPARDGHAEIAIEVKSGAYLQTWRQRKYSEITFGRLRSQAWDPEIADYEGASAYHADVYVFAVLTCKDPAVVDPLDLAQWDFRLLPRRVLEELGTKSIAWARVQQLAPETVRWDRLSRAVRAATND